MCFNRLAVFSDHYDKFSGSVWTQLMLHHSADVRRTAYKNCRWDKLAGSSMAMLVAKKPKQFKKHIDTSKLTASSWKSIIFTLPEYAQSEEYFAFKLRGKKVK